MARPFVVIHNIVSVDGHTGGFDADVGQYYDAAAALEADCMLTGSDTILKAVETEGIRQDAEFPEEPPVVSPSDERPLLVIVDSKGQINVWQSLREAGYWRDTMALVSESTPATYLEYLRRGHIQFIMAGADRVDMAKALDELGKRGTRRVRTDSGGTLNGVLLRQGLVDEVSVLVQPVVAPGGYGSVVNVPEPSSGDCKPVLQIISSRRLRGGVVWLRYKVAFS